MEALHRLDAYARCVPAAHRPPEVTNVVNSLLDEASALIADKRWIEEDFVFPLLLEHTTTQQDALMSREQGRVIGELLGQLRSLDPSSHSFEPTVGALLDAAQSQIRREEERLLPAGERVTPDHFARNLARRLHR